MPGLPTGTELVISRFNFNLTTEISVNGTGTASGHGEEAKGHCNHDTLTAYDGSGRVRWCCLFKNSGIGEEFWGKSVKENGINRC